MPCCAVKAGLKTYTIVYDRVAADDLADLQNWIAIQASERIAAAYIAHLKAFCRRLRNFPQRGDIRDDIRPGVRLIGFEHRVNVAFEVQKDRVVIIRLLYGGHQL